MTEYTKAHQRDYRMLGANAQDEWREALPPDLESGDHRRRTGRMKGCSYCGSMHPSDVVAAIQQGAHGSWADRKYGWPHKAYFDGVPNPHAGLLEIRETANFKAKEHWTQVGEREWAAPPEPARATVYSKFYSVHLLDATPEEKDIIERHLGIQFNFTDDGKVSWVYLSPA